MKDFRPFLACGRPALFRAALLALLAIPALGQWEQPPASMTSEMKQAILFYEGGKDDEAMDLFMDILVKGDPNEKALANDYLNRITRRITHGEHNAPPPSLPSVTPPPARTPSPQAAPPAPRTAPAGDRGEIMRKEIALKIAQMRKAAMAALQGEAEVKVVEERAFAVGVGLPTSRLFGAEIAYRLPEAERLLSALGDLCAASGNSVIHILPEGFVLNESKIQDLRRAMAVGSYLGKRGLSQARIKVQLVGTRVQVPNALNDFRGIVVVFANDEPLDLRAESAPEMSLGPSISLGVHPEALKVSKGEGVVIEFSVLEPPEGLASWKFQMLMPPLEGSTEMGVLQEVVGENPVFHQIYWNGRKNFFGEVLPFGRYVCILKARDLKGRESAIKREIVLERPAAPAPRPQPRPVEIKPRREAPAEPESRRRSPKRTAFEKRSLRRRILRQGVPPPAETALAAAPLPAGAPPAGEEAAPQAALGLRVGGTVNFPIYFERETVNILPNMDKPLQQVSANLAQYPRANVSVDGFAFKGEPQAAKLAEKRAEVVSGLLVNKYGIDPGRVRQESKVVDTEEFKVDIYIIAQ